MWVSIYVTGALLALVVGGVPAFIGVALGVALQEVCNPREPVVQLDHEPRPNER